MPVMTAARSVFYPMPAACGAAVGAPIWSVGEVPARPVVAESAVRQADRVAMSLAGARAQVVLPLARAAAVLKETRAWRLFGYACLDDFTRERYGRCGRWLSDLAKLDAYVKRLPALGQAISGEDGGHPLHVSAALAIGEIAEPQTLASWVALARASTLARLRHEIRRAAQADSKEPLAPDGLPGEKGPDRRGGAGAAGATPAAEAANAGGEPLQDEDVIVRMMVPLAMRAAFRETLDLFRAVRGSDRATVTAFVGALLAECSTEEGAAMMALDDIHADEVSHAPSRASMEEARARAAGDWKHLDDGVRESWALRIAGSSLERLKRLARVAGCGDARRIDAQLRELLGLEGQLELRLGEVLLEMGAQDAWMRLGFDSVGHYAERRLGISRTVAEDRLWAARAIRPYAMVRQAYERGELTWEATRALLHIIKGMPADEASQRLWIEHARGTTVKRLRDELRGRLREAALGVNEEGMPGSPDLEGDRRPAQAGVPDVGVEMAWPPEDEEGRELSQVPRAEPTAVVSAAAAGGEARRPAEAPGMASVEAPGGAPADAAGAASAETTSATRPEGVRDWRRRRELKAPGPMTDAGWHAGLRREPGSTRACMAALGRVLVQEAEGMHVMRRSEGEVLRVRLPAELGLRFRKQMHARRAVLRRLARQVPEGEPWPDPDAAASFLVTRIFSTRGWVEPAWVGLLWMLEHCVDVWDRSEGSIGGRDRAELFARAGYRCAAPGCTSREMLQDHHLVFRSHGGGNGLENRESLCVTHHQIGIHGGLASARGEAPLGVTWRLGREDLGEWFRNERRLGRGE